MDKRLFIGFKVPRKIIDVINMLRSTLIDKERYYNWVSGNNLHLTLLFLGSQGINQIDSISKKVGIVANQFNDFNIQVRGTGTFFKNHNEQILWLGVNEQNNILDRINYELRNELEDFIDLKITTKFLPHMTIARKKKKHINNKIDVKNFMNSVYSPMGFHIKYFTLFESSIVENKVHYKIIEKFNLT